MSDPKVRNRGGRYDLRCEVTVSPMPRIRYPLLDLGFEREILRSVLNQDQSAMRLDLDEILGDSRLDKTEDLAPSCLSAPIETDA